MINKRRDLLERWHGDREGSKKEAVQLQGISQRGPERLRGICIDKK